MVEKGKHRSRNQAQDRPGSRRGILVSASAIQHAVKRNEL
jgi:RNase P protein component